ncbi:MULTISPECIES: hypothetical protein [unclassified Microcoleus]|uniref:hypothetical protein n=1 Tax=unclassified Microcoleus TaxID=2642155 RepID=UPI002FD31F3D
MEIKKIGYGRASVHDFESTDYREYCYVEADLEAWEDAEQSLKLLRSFVNGKVGIYENIDELERQREALKVEVNHLRVQKDEAKKQWDKIEAFFKKLDLNPEYDPIPF